MGLSHEILVSEQRKPYKLKWYVAVEKVKTVTSYNSITTGSYKHHDKWIFYNEKGKKTQEGSFNEGLKNGKWIAYFEDGKLTEGEYKDGKKDGTWTSWWDYDKTRKEMQGSYKSGKMVDKWYFYNNKGNLKEIRYFSPVF